MGKFTIVSWLKETMEESSMGSVRADKLWSRFEEATACTTNMRKSLGKTLKKIFPNIVVSTTRDKATKKTVNLYRGITWKSDSSHHDESVSLHDMRQYIPDTAIVLPRCGSDCIKLAIPSKIISNGNIVLKQIDIYRDHWELSIRGKNVDLRAIDIDSSLCTLSKDTIPEILSLVDKVKVCTGLPAKLTTNGHSMQYSSKCEEEHISIQGDENSSCKTLRSHDCNQVVQWSALTETCYVCQVRCRPYKNNNIPVDKKSTPQEDVEAAEILDVEDTLNLDGQDHKDISCILSSVFKDAPEDMKVLLQSQYDAVQCKSPNQRRWKKEVISLCLNLWIRSPKSYNDLKDSNMLILPSGRQLARYKNWIPQSAGIDDRVFQWMYHAAKEAKIPKHGWAGGLIHDEAKIQQDLVLSVSGGQPKLIGWIDLGDEAFNLLILKDGHVTRKLATDVIQFIFIGYTGFRFPVCHFPTCGVKASELHIIIWDIIAKLNDWSFHVDFIMQDGGQENRQFIKSNFPLSLPLDSKYTSPNLVDPTTNIVHVQDFSHDVKKLRNSILSSGHVKHLHTRTLIYEGKEILWDHLKSAVIWDRDVNSRPIYHKITDTHLAPTNADKMRNHLAEDMLNDDMLHLMETYQSGLTNGTHLDSTISLLKQTSTLIAIFRDRRPVTSISDDRLYALKNTHQWFSKWCTSVLSDKNGQQAKSSKMLPSNECLDDLDSLILGFLAVCEQHLKAYPGSYIIPALFNSDPVENHFCQQRGLHNGNLTNPNYMTYSKTVNAVILGQTSISRGRKSNAGLSKAKPFNFYVRNAPP